MDTAAIAAISASFSAAQVRSELATKMVKMQADAAASVAAMLDAAASAAPAPGTGLVVDRRA